MNNPEQKFSLWLRSRLPGLVMRVENCIGAGVPDIYWCSILLGSIWIETKVARMGCVKLEKEQYAWGMRHTICGGETWVITLDLMDDYLYIYRYPIKIRRSGKYLVIVSEPRIRIHKNDFHVYLRTLNK